MTITTVGQLIEALQGYLQAGELSPASPLQIGIREVRGRHTIPTEEYDSPGLEIRITPEHRAARLIVHRICLSRKETHA